MCKILFRRISAADAPFLAAYGAACDGITDAAKLSRLSARFIRSVRSSCYMGVLAMAGRQPIGFQDGVVAGDTLELSEIYVHGRYRLRGVGLGLIRRILAIAKARGLKRAFLRTEPDNVAMRRLGRKAGFRREGLLYVREL
ncbi:MAG: GNAT family N-acetyltransferase [Elusimicrobia bacterium]|nr:GNAT family N-acetyltransferase [Elusimicrobiota bacterium]